MPAQTVDIKWCAIHHGLILKKIRLEAVFPNNHLPGPVYSKNLFSNCKCAIIPYQQETETGIQCPIFWTYDETDYFQNVQNTCSQKNIGGQPRTKQWLPQLIWNAHILPCKQILSKIKILVKSRAY